MHEKFLGISSIPEIRAIKAHKDAKDWIQLMDWPGFTTALRKCGYSGLAGELESGDEITGNAIDERANAIEASLLLTTGHMIRDSVSGASPNVPAYIMGNPYNMRQKTRDKTGRGPLALFIEMTGSGGLAKDDMIERGAALYALVRAVSIMRPLELWITMTYGGEAEIMTQSAVRVETNPLDFARAATILTRFAPMANAAYALNRQMVRHGGGWAYNVPHLERKYAGEILGRIISPGSQIAYLPAGLLGRDDFSDPQEWIRKMLREYSPYLLSGEDREDWEESVA